MEGISSGVLGFEEGWEIWEFVNRYGMRRVLMIRKRRINVDRTVAFSVTFCVVWIVKRKAGG